MYISDERSRIEKEIRSKYPNTHLGFKKYRDGRFVVLEILGDHNEDRKDIIDKNYAKFRCSKARVLMIFNMLDAKVTFESVYGMYRVDEIVKPDYDYCTDIDKVCESGIHYFLSIKAAFYYEHIPIDGLRENWHDNGQIFIRSTYKDGEKYGPYKSWHYNYNGHIFIQSTYKDGKLDGQYESWHRNGQIRNQCTYEDGKRVGPYEYWYD